MIVYEGETDEQAAERERRMKEHNAEIELMRKAFDAPMQGLSNWDCCCPMLGRFDCDNPKCPRRS